jgi:hypothetical protein
MNNAINPKRVAGGIVLGGKKKKKKRKVATTTAEAAILTTGGRSSSVPSILKSVPPQQEEVDSSSLPKAAAVTDAAAAAVDYDDGFEELLSANDDEIPNDVLLCLQSYTQASSGGGMISESCAYCPIFDSNNNKSCTHAAPFLTKDVLLHILDADDSAVACSSTSRMQTEKELKDLAARNKIKLMQLHGTSIATFTKSNTATSTTAAAAASKDSMKFSNSGVTGLRGDGNDDDDIAIMEIGAYETAVKMALQCHLSTLSHQEQQTFNVDIISDWFLNQLVPYFAGKTWISSSALHSFIQSYRVKEYWSVEGMEKIIHVLTMAGLFLPRRGLGGSGGMDGYWFYLPGMGNASKSIANGRVAMLRKLKSCKYQEKKRTILESEHGVFKDGSSSGGISDALDNSWGSAKKNKVAIQQSGKFLVLDLLARGLVTLKQTSSGEHFIGLPK